MREVGIAGLDVYYTPTKVGRPDAAPLERIEKGILSRSWESQQSREDQGHEKTDHHEVGFIGESWVQKCHRHMLLQGDGGIG